MSPRAKQVARRNRAKMQAEKASRTESGMVRAQAKAISESMADQELPDAVGVMIEALAALVAPPRPAQLTQGQQRILDAALRSSVRIIQPENTP